MKKLLYTLLFCIISIPGLPQTTGKRQVSIPLNNLKGVPFYKATEVDDWVIDGFEIDDKNNFYFFGGYPVSHLAVFSGNTQLFNKAYNRTIPPSPILIYKNNLYTFDRGKNSIVVLDPINGSLVKTYDHILKEHVNSYKFVDSSLVVEFLNDDGPYYELYSLSGKHLKKALDPYNIPPAIIPLGDLKSPYFFIGMWNDKYVFWDVENNRGSIDQYLLVSSTGKILATKALPQNNRDFGNDYYEDFPTEHRKVRNGNLYVLGRKG